MPINLNHIQKAASTAESKTIIAFQTGHAGVVHLLSACNNAIAFELFFCSCCNFPLQRLVLSCKLTYLLLTILLAQNCSQLTKKIITAAYTLDTASAQIEAGRSAPTVLNYDVSLTQHATGHVLIIVEIFAIGKMVVIL